jgi:hypothetical protein
MSLSCLHQVPHLHARLTQQIEEDAKKKNIPQLFQHEKLIQLSSSVINCHKIIPRKTVNILNGHAACMW